MSSEMRTEQMAANVKNNYNLPLYNKTCVY